MRMINMSLEERGQLLDSLEWPIQLSESELEKLSEFILVYEVGEGEQIFQEGEEACFLSLISRGDVRIVKENAAGEPQKIALLKQGEIFGEMALIDGYPRSASAYADSDSLLLFLTGDNFNELRLEFSVLGMKVLTSIAKAMSLRLRLTNDWLIDALNHSHHDVVEIEAPTEEAKEEKRAEEKELDLFAPPAGKSPVAFKATAAAPPAPLAPVGGLFATPTGTHSAPTPAEDIAEDESDNDESVDARLDALEGEVTGLRERIEALEAGE